MISKIKTIALATLLLACSISNAFAEDNPTKKKGILDNPFSKNQTLKVSKSSDKHHAIKLNPLSLIWKTVNMQYQYALSENKSLQLGVYYFGATFSSTSFTGIGITPEYRWYFAGTSKGNMNGWFLGPYARYESYTLSTDYTSAVSTGGGISLVSSTISANLTGIGAGGIIGYQLTTKGGFTFDAFSRLGYANYGITLKDGASESAFSLSSFNSGITYTIGASLGYAF